jgi:hypothetical protein
MVVRGRVRNGVVVLDGGVRLDEGQEVTVLVPGLGQAIATADSHATSLLDIPPVSLGPVVRSLTADDDLLSEMLQGRT